MKIIKKSKSIQLIYCEKSMIVSQEPCWVYSFIASTSALAATLVQLRSGVNRDVKFIYDLYVNEKNITSVVFATPQFFPLGLWVRITDPLTLVTIQFSFDKLKE